MRFGAAGVISLGLAGGAFAQPAPPTLHFAPDRWCHVLRAVTQYDIDEVRQRATATVLVTYSTLRENLTTASFDTSAEKVLSVEVDGKPVKFSFASGIHASVAGGPAGSIHTLKAQIEGSFFHWFKPSPDEPERIGFYTEGLSGSPVGWAAPNDRYATELHITLPAAWSAYSNGLLVSDTAADPKRHTVVWRMDEPHPNYLNSIVVGPFVEHRDKWRGHELLTSCPPSLVQNLDSTFSATKDILDFYSDRTGVPYPWSKYGQNLTFDHSYAEENVTATMYPVYWGERPFLTDARDGRRSEWVIAHETAHHWFGDYITCKDWGDTWINEGFATFMEMMYTLHSRGRLESLRELESYSQRFFQDSKRDFRPIATNNYSDSTGMGGWTTYNKGGGVLMSLREQLGDDAFWRGIRLYMKRWGGGNAESNDFCEAMTDATGINLHPFMDQWVYKPGHPVIDWSWAYDPAARQVMLHVRQTQDTSRGIPIYTVPTHVGIVTAAGLARAAATLNAADQTISIPSAEKPDTVLFDCDHEFVREIPTEPWTAKELPLVIQFAPNPIDRDYALAHLVDNGLTDGGIQAILASLRKDREQYCAVRDTLKLAGLNLPELHDFWVEETKHPNIERRTCAATGLAGVSRGPADFAILKGLLADDQPYTVVAAALRGLASLDFPEVGDFALKAAKTSKNQDIRAAALDVLADAKAPGWDTAILETAAEGHTTFIRRIGVRALTKLSPDDSRLAASVRSALHAGEDQVVSAAIEVAGSKHLTAVLPDLQALKARGAHVGEADAAIQKISR
jgi:aminopeptidase N